MPERKQVAPKTYTSKYLSFSLSFPIGEGDDRASDTIRFVGGEYTTSFEDEQKHLEGNPFVAVKPSARIALAATATSLRAAAVKANAAAKEAEDALAAFDKPVPKPVA